VSNLGKPIINLENFLEFIAEHLDEEFSAESFTIDDSLALKIRISGEQWQDACKDGYIDYRAANLLISLQTDYFAYCSAALGRKIDFRSRYDEILELIIQAKFSDGSLTVVLNNALTTLVGKMSGWQAFGIAAIAILVGGGYLSFSDYNKRVIEIQKIISDENKSKVFAEVNNNAIKAVENSQETLRTVTRYMANSDTYSNDSAGIKNIHKDELNEYILSTHGNSENDTQSFWMDARFKLHILNFEKGSMQLESGSFKKYASTKLLSNENKTLLLEGAKGPIVENYLPEYNLQTSVVFQGDQISEVYIVGVGEPRPGALTPAEIMKKVHQHEKKEKMEQGTLPFSRP
jgi:hypothetical protein